MGYIILIILLIVVYFYNLNIDHFRYSSGLAYPIVNENKIMKQIIDSNFNIKLMSEYADLNTKIKINECNKIFLDKQFDKSYYIHFNPNYLGNIAYIILHSPELYKTKASKWLKYVINKYGHRL